MNRFLWVVLALLLVLTGCTQYIFDFTDWWDKNPGVEITDEEVAKNFSLTNLNDAVARELAGVDVPGIRVKVSRSNPEKTVTASLLTPRTTAATLYIEVIFEAESGTAFAISDDTVVTSGRLLLTAKGTEDEKTKTIKLESYTTETVEPLQTVTRRGNTEATVEVKISITEETVITGTITETADNVFECTEEPSITTPSSSTAGSVTIGDINVPASEAGEAGGLNGLFESGYGTEESPYEISTILQFLNIGSNAVQELILEGHNENLYFELTNNIDLRGHSGYVGTFFSGTLIGNNHTITGSNSIGYMFNYYFEQARFEDFTVVFDDSNITLIVSNPAMRAISYDSAEQIFTVEDNTLSIVFDNVDFRAPAGNEDYYYTVRDNNSALYLDGTVPEGFAVIDGEVQSETMWTYGAETQDGERITHIAEIKDCDVDADFIGGFSNSGAAIFVGGQFFDTQISITDCAFNGTLIGQYTSLLVANSNMCYPNNPSGFPYECKLTAENVRGGNIISLEGKGTLHFSNSGNTTAIKASNVTGNYQKLEPAKAISVSGNIQNGKLQIAQNSTLTDAEVYQVKLSLPSLYWYDSGINAGSTATTDSNTFTIEYPVNETKDIYIAKPITRLEADALSGTYDEFAAINWNNAEVADNGLEYLFIDVDGTMFLVIDYSDYATDVLYSDSGIPNDINDYKYSNLRIVIALDQDNNIIGTNL